MAAGKLKTVKEKRFEERKKTRVILTLAGVVLTMSLGVFSLIANFHGARAETLLADGDLDTTFDGDGKATIQVAGFDSGRDVAIQADGKIVVAGSALASTSPNPALVRLNSDGSVDTGFATNGRLWHVSPLGGQANGVAIQPDGKIVVSVYGLFQPDPMQFNVAAHAVIRLNPNGTLDTTFGTNGYRETSAFHQNQGGNATEWDSELVIQPDGKIIVVGRDTNATGGGSFVVLRLTANGAFDTDFGTNGKVKTDFTANRFATAYSVLLQPDGKILVGGGVDGTSYINTNFRADDNSTLFGVARYNADGSLDATFDSDGRATVSFSTAFASAEDLALQADGKIVLAGRAGASNTVHNAALARLLPDGSLDTTFDGDGRVVTTVAAGSANALNDVHARGGKIVATGWSRPAPTSTDGAFLLLRYNDDGSPDTSFGADGALLTEFTAADDLSLASTFQPDGKLVLAGRATNDRDFAVARYLYSGDSGTPTPTPTMTITPTMTPTVTPTITPTPTGNFIVTNTNNSGAGSLRQAVLDSNSTAGSDTIVFSSLFNTPQTITLASVITINPATGDSLTIVGPGANLLTVSGNNAVQIFSVSSGDTASISGMTVAQAVGGAVANSGNLTVTNCVFNANTDSNGGGAITNSLMLTVNNCAFTSNTNTAPGVNGAGGGAIHNTGTATISNSIFSNNATNGGAGGGAIDNRGVMSLTGSTLNGNATTFDAQNSRGGAINIQSAGQLTINNSLLTGNSSVKEGGAIYYQPNTTSGPPFLNITNSTISNNTANSDNNTTGEGGGLYLTGTGSVTITDSTINGNRANAGATGTNGDGGGIATSTVMTMTNSTVSGNTAGRTAGGIHASGVSTAIVTIESSTIVNNTATTDGGGIVRASSTNPVNLHNTIIANNADDGTAPDVFGTVNSQGYNLIEKTTGATINGVTTGNIIGVDPFLDNVLRDNGGATKTHALRLISPALDAADPANFPATDQRGLPRPVDGNNDGTARADIGAYERQTADRTTPELFDFDGDGRADISVFRPMPEPAANFWYVLQSSNNTFSAAEWGIESDRLVPADYDGDGRTDYAVYRGDGEWYISQSTNLQLRALKFGLAEDIPVPGDFDGDERADIAVFRPSNGVWYRLNSSDGQFAAVQFGAAGDRPLIGDYDGDAKADITVFRPSDGVWYRLNSSNNQFVAAQFGAAGDVPLSGDFNGDGFSDLAVFRPANGFWYVARPTGTPAQNFDAIQFGQNGDNPVAADYDDDGRTDIAVYRMSGGNWFVMQSGSNSLTITNFGAPNDKPIPASFLP